MKRKTYSKLSVFALAAALMLCITGVLAGPEGTGGVRKNFAAAAEHGPNSYFEGEAAHIDLGRGYNELPYFSEGEYTFRNYQNGYTKTKNNASPAEVSTYFGRNAFPADGGGVEIRLIDLSEREISPMPGELGEIAIPVDEDPLIISAAFQEKYKEVVASGFSLGTTHSGIINLSGLIIQEFKWTDSTFNYVSGITRYGWAALIYNPALKKCFLVKDNMARTLPSVARTLLVGAPVSDEFTTTLVSNGTEYVVQNFARGYFRVEAGFDKVGTVSEYRNITRDGYEQILTGGDRDRTVGAVDEKYADGNYDDRNHVGRAVRARYYESVAENLNPGFERSYVKAIQGVWMQFFQGENSSFSTGASAYEMHLVAFQPITYLNIAAIVYNPVLQQAFMVKDDFLTCYLHEDIRFLQDAEGNDTDSVNFNHADIRMATVIRQLGAPVGEMFAYDGARYQNFENGYIKRAGTSPTTTGLFPTTGGSKDNAVAARTAASYRDIVSADSEIVGWGKNISAVGEIFDSGYEAMDFDGRVSIAAQTEKLGAVGLTSLFDERLETVRAEKADTEIVKASPVKGVWQVGISSTIQELSEDSGDGKEASALSYNLKNNAVYYLDPTVYAVYKEKALLGAAIAELESVDGYFRQPFEHGYITYKDGEAAAAKVGYVYNTVSKKFVNESFIDRVGVITTLAGKDPVKNASFSGYTEEDITRAVRAAYQEFFAKGVNIGIPDEKGVFWWQTGRTGLICQQFIGGDGDGDYEGTSQMLCFDTQQHKAFLMTGEIYSEYCRYLPMIVGTPAQNAVTAKDGTIAQNFFGPMGDFCFLIGADGRAEYFDYVFRLDDYEASLENTD